VLDEVIQSRKGVGIVFVVFLILLDWAMKQWQRDGKGHLPDLMEAFTLNITLIQKPLQFDP
jgi:hypothetical protein